MKKLLFWLAVTSLLILTACGGGEKPVSTNGSNQVSGDEKESQTSGDDEKRKITFWFIDTGDRKAVIEEAVQRFESKHPDVVVEAVQIQNDAYKTKLSVAMGGGNPPDVFHSWGGGWLKQFVDAGQVLDITDKIDKEQYLPAAINNATYDNKIYGAPLGISLVPFYYNKEIFAKYNLQPPKTYGEFINIVETLNKNGVIPIALANKTKWPGAFYLMYFADRIGGSDLFTKAYTRNGKTFDDPAYIKAGEMIQDLVKRGAFVQGFNGLDYDTGQSRQLMYTEKAAMILQTTAFISAMRSEFPDLEKKIGIFLFPAVEGGKGDPTSVVGGISPVFSAAKKSKHPELAVELIKELTSKETAQQFTDRAGVLVAVKGVEYKDPSAKQLDEMLRNAAFMQTYYDQTLPPELAELHKDTTQQIFGLSITPEEAAKQMEKLAKQVLK